MEWPLDNSWSATWRYVAGLAVVGVLMRYAFVWGERVPLLWAADLGFHELGHLLARPLGTTAHFLAGSATQVLVPLGLAVYFWLWQRDLMAVGVVLGWAAASAQDASVYVADAPYQRLPLIGGHHDWNWLLSHWQQLDNASGIARGVWVFGLAVGLLGIVAVATPLFRQWRLREMAAEVPLTVPRQVREARFRPDEH